ncbi:hypothetical protein LCI18_008927 [Fusarium solani-melongenae]|uniref:Uncharacterized protein n=1 Tax=Fusarium solani subsp. cucurbitae TaxID=2747967 RepID=A0ACD3ZA32_FUSSC|nr:hypothetical protein LCI18_008927 [Fusarium solani-melongenae]
MTNLQGNINLIASGVEYPLYLVHIDHVPIHRQDWTTHTSGLGLGRYLFIIVYALTLAPMAWIYAAEVWSTGTRATGTAIAAEANWLFNFALGMFTPPGFKNIELD